MAEWAIAIGALGTFATTIWAIVGYLMPMKTDLAVIKVDNATMVRRMDRHSDDVRRVKDKQRKLETDSDQTVLILKETRKKVEEQEARLDQLTHEHDRQMGAGGCGRPGDSDP